MINSLKDLGNACPFNSDKGTLAAVGMLGAAHAAAMIIAPNKVTDNLHFNAQSGDTVTASTRTMGAAALASAAACWALSKHDDAGTARRAVLAAQGVGMLGVAAIQGMETHKERNKKNIGWAMTAAHGMVGATCLYRGLKDGIPK